ncbi:MAG: hypothetical protein M3Y66_00485 [Actinomycetota bacterium]|nr:hypothetical protein [Actinomycetota bacterium]
MHLLSRLSRLVEPTTGEIAARLPGDDLVPADVVMDRAFTLQASPEQVWPWLVQVGKGRAGWYFPRSVERFISARRRGARRIVPQLQEHEVGQTIADWGGRDATLTVAEVREPSHLVYRSQRGRASFSWALTLTALAPAQTRVHSRVRMGPIRHRQLTAYGGGAFDLLTILGLAAGLQERLRDTLR